MARGTSDRSVQTIRRAPASFAAIRHRSRSARPGDEDVAAESSSPARRIPCSATASWLAAGRDPHRHRIGDRHALVGTRQELFAEAALDVREDRRRAEETHVAAQVRAAGTAIIAGEAGPARIDRDPVAGPDACDRRARPASPCRRPRGRAPSARVRKSPRPGPCRNRTGPSRRCRRRRAPPRPRRLPARAARSARSAGPWRRGCARRASWHQSPPGGSLAADSSAPRCRLRWYRYHASLRA